MFPFFFYYTYSLSNFILEWSNLLILKIVRIKQFNSQNEKIIEKMLVNLVLWTKRRSCVFDLDSIIDDSLESGGFHDRLIN